MDIVLVIILSFFVDVAFLFFVYKALSCNHKWESDIEYTENDLLNAKYKIITMKCTKCGKVKVEKYKINS